MMDVEEDGILITRKCRPSTNYSLSESAIRQYRAVSGHQTNSARTDETSHCQTDPSLIRHAG